MNRLIILIISLYMTSNLIAQDDGIWIMKYDSTKYESCGYVDLNGNIKIPFGKYRTCYTDTFRTFAIVLKDKEGFIGIDKLENKLFTVYPFDNGPDYVTDGTFRIIENSKMGVADTTGRIIIQPIYDFTFGFESGLALVNIGGHREKTIPNDPNCEYYTWTGGLWGVVNKQGKIVLKIKYHYFLDLKTGISELTRRKEKHEIKTGQIIKKK